MIVGTNRAAFKIHCLYTTSNLWGVFQYLEVDPRAFVHSKFEHLYLLVGEREGGVENSRW